MKYLIPVLLMISSAALADPVMPTPQVPQMDTPRPPPPAPPPDPNTPSGLTIGEVGALVQAEVAKAVAAPVYAKMQRLVAQHGERAPESKADHP